MNLQKMMKQAQELQSKMAEMQAKLEHSESEGSAGGGMVKITINGKGHALKVVIDPKLLEQNDKEMLEDLTVAAFNDAKSKSETNFAEQMSTLTSGLQLPPGFKMPF